MVNKCKNVEILELTLYDNGIFTSRILEILFDFDVMILKVLTGKS